MKRTTTAAITIFAAIVLLVAALMARPVDQRPYSPGNYSNDGLAAFDAVLGEYGVSTRVNDNFADVVSVADSSTTVVLPADEDPLPEQLEELLDTGARVILIHRGFSVLRPVWGFSGDIEYYSDVAYADCDDPDAIEAEPFGPAQATYVGDEAGCFKADDGYLWTQSSSHENLFLFTGTLALTNEHLAEGGNAAFGVRKFGANEKLIWMPEPLFFAPGESAPTVIPAWLTAGSLAALLTGIWACVYAARRFGKLVAEPLPVVVPAAETDLGRALLYQRGNNISHAAQVLRADFIDERSKRLGITSRSRPEEISRLIAQSANQDPRHVHDLLFARPISSERDLVDLANALSNLQKETTHVPVL